MLYLKEMRIERGRGVLFTRRPSMERRTFHLVLLSFILPILAMLPGLIYAGIMPFGPNTTFAVDLRHEYVGFYEAFRHALGESGGFFYNFSKALGGEMIGTYSYYVFSPFNLLFFLFPRDMLPVIVEITQLLKLGIAGASFSLLLIYTEHGRDWRVVLFSTMYGLLSFATANLLNHMWLDPIMVFPLVILGLERLFRGKSPLLYVSMLVFSVVTNFYIGYMGCIFLVFYSIFALVRQTRPTAVSRGRWFAHQFGQYARFTMYSLIAGAIAAVVLVPTVYSITLAKGAYASEVVAPWKFNYFPADFFSKMIPGAFNYDQVPSGLPNVFTGTMTLIFSFLYFFNRRISRRERFAAFLVLAILMLSMMVDKLNVIWHGMAHPIWYEYRFSWLFSFFTALLAFRSMMRTARLIKWQTAMVILLYIAMIAYMALNLKRLDHVLIYHLIGAPIFFALFMTAILLKDRHRASCRVAILVLAFAEMAINAGVHTAVFSYESMEEFQFFEHAMMDATASLRPKSDQFYRIEKTFMHDNNDAMRFNYPGLTHFNSALERKTIDFIGSLGFAVTSNSINGTNPTAITDAIFGVRYYLQGRENLDDVKIDGVQKLKAKSDRPDLDAMKLIRETEYIRVFENEQAMPLGMLAEKPIETLKSERANPMDFQDRIFNLLDGRDDEVNYLIRLPIDKTRLFNLKETVNAGGSATYNKEDKEKEAYVAYEYQLRPNARHYMSVSNLLNSKNSKLVLNGEPISNKRTSYHKSSQVYNVSGTNTSIDKQVLKVQMDKEKTSFTISNVSLFALDESAFEQALAFQKKNGLRLSRADESQIVGEFTATEKTPYLMLSLPYDKGWKASVDGKAVQPIEVLEAMMAIPVTPGTHQLVLSYEYPWFNWSLIISINATITFFGLLGTRCYALKKKEKAGNDEA